MSTAATPLRLPLVEYSSGGWTLAEAAEIAGHSVEQLESLVSRAQVRVRAMLRSRSPRLECDDDVVRAEGFAGLLRISPILELEVCPKFLGPETESWREDFFSLTTLSRFGRLLSSDALHSSRGQVADLATLVARALVELTGRHRRRPLRTYRQQTWREFSGDGRLEPEDLITPEADGFAVQGLRLTRDNPFNATIKAAALALSPEVRDGDTRRQLERLARGLGPQSSTARQVGRRRVLPSRTRHWQDSYDLACDVLEGFGIRYGNQASLAPGYLLDTWRAWEDLVELGLRSALQGVSIQSQAGHRLGARCGERGAGPVHVYPDLVVRANPAVVVDAKYKGRPARAQRIDEDDLYEALAFLKAVGATSAVLMYPATPPGGIPPVVGRCRVFETICVGVNRIRGVEVEVAGLSQAGGFAAFAAGMGAWFQEAGLC